MKMTRCLEWLLLLALLLATGCTGLNTFGTAARGGDTVALALGWHLGLSRETIDHVAVTDAVGSSVILTADDPAVRSVFNSYPDPLSRLLVGAEIGGPSIMSILIEGSVTAGDKEYAQTMLVLDLPQGLATGQASIEVNTIHGEVLEPVTVEVLPGVGEAASFENRENLTIGQNHLRAIERAPHYAIAFSGVTVPFGIQLDLSHEPDSTLGGVGYPYVVNPRGDIKNVSWYSDGTSIRVVVLPSRDRALKEFSHLKFYVAGGVLNLRVEQARGFDDLGNQVDGVTATIH